MQLFDRLHAFLWESMHINNCNTYLVDGPMRILIDPGHDALFDHVEQGLRDLNLTIDDIDLIICTHAHPDHIEAILRFKHASTLITMHESDWQLLQSWNNQMGGISPLDKPNFTPDFFLQEGRCDIDGVALEIYHTPGHSPGSISLFWPETSALFTGDLVFREGFGRTDLPGGDSSQLKQSITRMGQIDARWLLPGHGAVIEGEKKVQENFEEISSFYLKYI